MIVSCIVSVVSVNAQLLSLKSNTDNNKEAKKRQAIISKKAISDPHWKFSDYDPKKSKKEQKELDKQTKELAARSYSPKKSPYYDKKEAREQKAKEIRKKRLNEGKNKNQDRKVQAVRRDSDKKYQKKQKIRTQKVKENKKNFGTKASRKQYKTTARLTLKDMK
jgi:hypothetical protein